MSPSGGDTTVVLQPITWSPGNSTPCSAKAKHMWFDVWPGVCTPRDRPPRPAGHDPAVGDAARPVGRRKSVVSSTFTPSAISSCSSSSSSGVGRWMGPEGVRRGPGLLAQPGGQRRVIAVAVGDADRRDPLAGERRGQGVAVGVEHRAGIDDGDLALTDDVRPGAAVGELRRVLGDHPPQHRGDTIDAAVDDVVERSEVRRLAHRRPDQRADMADGFAVAEDRLRDGVGGEIDAERAQGGDHHRCPRPTAAVGDLQRHRPAVGQRRDMDALGAVLGHQPGHQAHQPGHVACRPADHLRVARHRPVHRVPIDGEGAHAPGQSGQRHDRRRRAAAVDTHVTHRPRDHGEVVEDHALQRMVGGGVPGDRPPVADGRGQHPRMLAAAVLQDRSGRRTRPHGVEHGVGVERQRRGVLEAGLVEASAGEDLPHRGDVLGAPVVAGAHDRQQAIVERQDRRAPSPPPATA